MKKWLAVVTAFISVYVFFLIAFLPANFVINNIKLPAHIQLGQVSGSVWHSKVDSVRVAQTLVKHVNINVNWLSLLQFNPSLDVKFGGALFQGPEGHLTVSGFLSNITITDLQLDVHANEIASQLPLIVPVEAKNTVSIIVSEFVMGQPVCQKLSGKVKWNKASIITLSEHVPLGTLNATLSCVNGNGLAILDENNDLGVSFSAELSDNAIISGNGYLTPHNNLPKAIEQVLPFLGNQDKQGRYRLVF